MDFLLVMAGGALGSGARLLVGRAADALAGPGFPYGTLGVNLAGGLLMGLLAGLVARGVAGENWRLFAGVGLLGGFTTFSAFSLELVRLGEQGAAVAVGYAILSVGGSIVAVLAGFQLARVWA